MNGGKKHPLPGGYTLVEVMIFLAVSGALLASALLLVGGQQNKTQFSQSIRDIDSKIRDVLNDVSSGVYNNAGNFKCTADNIGGAPVIIAGAVAQGTNAGCTFIGRVFQFSSPGANDTYRIYSVVGRQYTGAILSSQQTQNLPQAKPVPLARSSSNPSRPDSTESSVTDYGLNIATIKYDNGGGPQPIGAFGFFTSFANYPSGSPDVESGKQNTDLWAIPASTLNEDPLNLAEDIINIGGMSVPAASAFKNPSKGIVLCFNSGGTKQYGTITIGEDGSRLTTKLDIEDGVCPP